MAFLPDIVSRQSASSDTTEIIPGLSDGATTEVGRQSLQIRLSDARKNYTAPGPLGSSECTNDACCVWDYIQRDLVQIFQSLDGTCSRLARSSVRLGFHDAGTWSTTSGYGGADGSLLLSSDEINRFENNGLQQVRSTALGILDSYSQYEIVAADLVQFMHNVATVVCPLGPRIVTLIGLNDSSVANPSGLVPGNNATDGEYLIELFRNKTLKPRDLVALVGAHTVGQQYFVDPSRAGQPLDSTPGVWDVDFYREVTSSNSHPGGFRLSSDEALANTDETSSSFTAFGDRNTGQTVWNAEYATAYVRLSLLGVDNINHLTHCTKVLPDAVTSFSSPSSTPTSPSSSLKILRRISLTLVFAWVALLAPVSLF
ncbi:hypothetical protein MW887_003535 [Aspergillus wentii]|nr:hypothetical protein MW887_003535 [Aspergillus wentii]